MAAIPAWPTQPAEAAPPEPRRGRTELGVVIPVLIGLVSVTVAVLAWRSSQLDENATDADRAGLADAAFVRLAELEASVFSSNLQATDAQLQVLAGEARALRAEADAGGPGAEEAIARAQELEAEVAQLGLLANRVLDDSGLTTPFDAQGAADAILAGNRELGRHQPDADFDRADDLRDRSLKLAALTAVLALAVLLLTAAQVRPSRRWRLLLLSGAVILWVGAIGAAVGVGLS